MQHRSRTKIAFRILEAAAAIGGDGNEGITKTLMMNNLLLSYAKLEEYLQILIENGLIDYDQKEGIFKTSQKGKRFLTTCKEIGKTAVSPTSHLHDREPTRIEQMVENLDLDI